MHTGVIIIIITMCLKHTGFIISAFQLQEEEFVGFLQALVVGKGESGHLEGLELLVGELGLDGFESVGAGGLFFEEPLGGLDGGEVGCAEGLDDSVLGLLFLRVGLDHLVTS